MIWILSVLIMLVGIYAWYKVSTYIFDGMKPIVLSMLLTLIGVIGTLFTLWMLFIGIIKIHDYLIKCLNFWK